MGAEATSNVPEGATEKEVLDPTLVGELEKRLVEKAGRIPASPRDDSEAAQAYSGLQARLDRVRRDLNALPVGLRTAPSERGEEGISEFIDGLNQSLEERGEPHRYLKVGDVFEIPAGKEVKKYRVLEIRFSRMTLSPSKDMEEPYPYAAGTDLYDRWGFPPNRELLPVWYLFEEVSASATEEYARRTL